MRILNIRTLALFTLLSTLTFISCQKDENTPVSKNGLIPMKTGNQWFYKYYWLDDNIVDTAVLSVGDYVNINGNKGFKFSSGDYPFHENFIFDNDDEGNCISVGGYSDKDTLFAPSVRYKIDAKKEIHGIFRKYHSMKTEYLRRSTPSCFA